MPNMQGAASDYYNLPGGVTQVGGIFGDLSPGPQAFLGGSANAANAYQGGITAQQNALLALQHNALAEPVAAPNANYGSSGPGSVGIGANTLQAQGQLSYLQGQNAYGGAQNAIAGAGNAFQGAQGQLGQQVQATGLAQQAAVGNVPSQAALQQSAGIGQAVRSQLSAAASTRGGAAQQAAAGQQAAMQGAQLQSQGINQAAQLRAQEMATARGQYLGATQANTGAAQAQTQAALAQAAAQQQQVGLSNQTSGLSLQQQAQAASQAQFQSQQQLQQNQLNNQLSETYGQQALGYGQLGLSGAQSQLAADTAYQQQLTQAKQAGNQSSTNFATGIIGAAGGILGALSDVRAKQNVQPAAGGQPAQSFGAQPAQIQAPQQAMIAPGAGQVMGSQQLQQPAPPPVSGMTKDQALAFLKGEPMPASSPMTPMNMYKARASGAMTSPEYRNAIDAYNAKAMNFTGDDATQAAMDNADPNAPPGLGYVPMSRGQGWEKPPAASDYNYAHQVTSDKDTKAGARGAQHTADAYLDKLAQSAATYSYKDPAQAPADRPAGARFGGVMAQDLETVPEIGKQLVSDTPQGKTLEGGSNLTAALMGLGRLHERLKALEASRGAR